MGQSLPAQQHVPALSPQQPSIRPVDAEAVLATHTAATDPPEQLPPSLLSAPLETAPPVIAVAAVATHTAATDGANSALNRCSERADEGAARGCRRFRTNTGYKGVTKKTSKKGALSYKAQITQDGKARCLGTFPTLEEAAEAFAKAALERPVLRVRA